MAKLNDLYDWVVIAAASSRGGDEAYKRVFGLGSENVARWLKSVDARTVVFISSTSVYPQINGDRVSENSTAPPENGPGKILLKAEQTMAAAGPTVMRSDWRMSARVRASVVGVAALVGVSDCGSGGTWR